MTIDLSSEPMLGHWDVSPSASQCEYQFGQRLVYVQHPKGISHSPYIARAQETIVETWEDIPNAIHFAEEISRSLIPGFWEAHDASQTSGTRFDVYSIHYELDNPHPSYVVGVSHDFEFSYVTHADDDLWKENPITIELPKPPDNFFLSVRRLGAKQFENAAT